MLTNPDDSPSQLLEAAAIERLATFFKG